MIAQERRLAADRIEALTPEQLRTPSLCGEWKVHDVAAHILMPLVTPSSKMMGTMLASGFNVNKANVKLTKAVTGRSAADIAKALRDRPTIRSSHQARGTKRRSPTSSCTSRISAARSASAPTSIPIG